VRKPKHVETTCGFYKPDVSCAMPLAILTLNQHRMYVQWCTKHGVIDYSAGFYSTARVHNGRFNMPYAIRSKCSEWQSIWRRTLASMKQYAYWLSSAWFKYNIWWHYWCMLFVVGTARSTQVGWKHKQAVVNKHTFRHSATDARRSVSLMSVCLFVICQIVRATAISLWELECRHIWNKMQVRATLNTLLACSLCNNSKLSESFFAKVFYGARCIICEKKLTEECIGKSHKLERTQLCKRNLRIQRLAT